LQAIAVRGFDDDLERIIDLAVAFQLDPDRRPSACLEEEALTAVLISLAREWPSRQPHLDARYLDGRARLSPRISRAREQPNDQAGER
jgi:hypothetical protein